MLLLNSLRRADSANLPSRSFANANQAFAASTICGDGPFEQTASGQAAASKWDDDNFLSYSKRQRDAEFPVDYDV